MENNRGGAGLLGSYLYGDLGVKTVGDDQTVANIPDLIPPEKLARFTWMPRDNNPTGISHLRAAYIPWRLKTKINRARLEVEELVAAQ